jgi:hypothetical protein
MTRSASVSHFGSEFDDFLFAPIGEERNGMPLSVLSALARLDVDPWQEAAKLALLPGETATQRLTSLIAALPERPSAHTDLGTIAAGLIALLPRRATSDTPSREASLRVGRTIDFPTIICLILVNATFLAFMAGAQWVAASHQPPAQIDKAAASSTASPQLPQQQVGQQAVRNQTSASAEPGQRATP